MTEFRKKDSRWKGVFSSSHFPEFSGAHAYQWVWRDLRLGVNQPQREADVSSSPSSEVNATWNILLLSLRLFMKEYLINRAQNVTQLTK